MRERCLRLSFKAVLLSAIVEGLVTSHSETLRWTLFTWLLKRSKEKKNTESFYWEGNNEKVLRDSCRFCGFWHTHTHKRARTHPHTHTNTQSHARTNAWAFIKMKMLIFSIFFYSKGYDWPSVTYLFVHRINMLLRVFPNFSNSDSTQKPK